MERMVRRKNAIDLLAFALNRKIAVQFHHRLARGDGVGAIHLDFVVILGMTGNRESNPRRNPHAVYPGPPGNMKLE